MPLPDPELFKDTAYYYARYRRGYPQELFDYLINTFNIDQNARVLDVGTGTGQIALPLAPIVKEVVAIDPEQEMLEEGKKVASERGIKNIKWQNLKAEDISTDLGLFQLTTIGAAFHWLDREKALENIYQVTENGGGVAIVSDFNRGTSPSYGEDWKQVRQSIVKKYLGEKRRAGNTFFKRGTDTFEDRLTNSPFKNYTEWNFDFTRQWKLEEVINFLYSTSFASRRLFGDKLSDFEQELRENLLKLEPEGNFKEEVRLQVLIAKK